jgi:peptidoglycan/LPS O-acetylase OafA/YrhL
LKTYRPDVDGLRAVAIIPVVLFHFGSQRIAPGGFVGVDVFFVISGFLITKIIYENVSNDRYSIIEFYEKRARRIFPALFLVFSFCLIATIALGLPSQVKDTSNSIISSALFVSNIFFYKSYGYFAQAAGLNPLLHTWSLSVEEQFYIVFPILVYAVRNFARRSQHIIYFLVLLASFTCSAILVNSDKNAAFYLLQSRAWELLIGTALAIGMVPAIANKTIAEVTGATGLALIIISIYSLSYTSNFPGINAIAPCVGASALLHSGHHRTAVSRLLSLPPLRFIGLISYSLYLWHWPIIVFYSYLREPDATEKLAVITGMILVSWLSWRYVETPFRTKPHYFSSRQTVSLAALAMVLGITSAIIWTLAPAPTESRRDYFASFMSRDWNSPMRAGSCFLTSRDRLSNFDYARCLRFDPQRKNILLIGDSHAADLWPGLNERNSSANLLQVTASGCKPFLRPAGATRCVDLMEYFFSDFLPKHPIDTIVISARWDIKDLIPLKITLEEISKFAGQIILIGPAPEFSRPLPRLLAQQSDPAYANLFRSAQPIYVENALKSQVFNTRVRYFSLQEILCNPTCLVWNADHSPIQFDYGHFTTEGSEMVGQKILAFAERR